MNYNFTGSEFRDWLKQNKTVLLGRSSDEVASMAHLVGFEWDVICPVLSHFQDALQGSRFERRADMQWGLECRAIDRRTGKVDLSDQWLSLYDYLQNGREF